MKNEFDLNLLTVILANVIIAVSAWTCATVLILRAHPVAGAFMIAMPLLFHIEYKTRSK